jgi:hypothetical protein
VRRAGVRWRTEENNEPAKQIAGLGQYQVRRWNSGHRHVACAMLALAFLTVQRARHPGLGQAPAPEHDAVSGATGFGLYRLPELHSGVDGQPGVPRPTVLVTTCLPW